MAMTTGELTDGTPVIVSGRYGGIVDVYRLADRELHGELLAAHDGMVTAVATGPLPDGTPVIISGGYDGTVRTWELADGAQRGEPLIGHRGAVSAVAVGALSDGRPVTITGGDDGTVRIWRHIYRAPHGQPLTGHHDQVMQWPSARCPMVSRSSSAAAATPRCGSGGWPTARRTASRSPATTAP